DEDLNVALANRAFYNAFNLSPEAVIGFRFNCVNEDAETAARLRAVAVRSNLQGFLLPTVSSL
ncbi:MAG: hypothetical protein ABIV39_05430, partial [Verrucomicrobiota bacterium]